MNLKRALLINPWIYDFSVYDLWMRPVGLLRTAADLRKNGYEIKFIDCLDNKSRRDKYGCGKIKKKKVLKPEPIKEIPRLYYRYGITEEEFKKILQEAEKPDLVYITSGMTYWYPGVKDTVRMVREYLNGIPVLLGGIYAVLGRDHALKVSGVDSIVNGSRINEYPAWDLLSSTNVIIIQTSFGCPFNCSYCGIKKISNGFYQRNYNEVINEIQYCVNTYSPEDIAFYDDALLVNPESHIKPLLREIIKRNIRVRFHTPNAVHARYLDKETAFLMKRSGFKTIRLGLETSGNKRRDNKVSNEEIIRAVGFLKEAGFSNDELGVYTMFGSFEDKPEDIYNDIEFVTGIAGVPIKLSAYSLVPGSDDYDRWGISADLDPLWHNNTIFPLLTGKYTLDKIRELRLFASARNKELLCGINH